MKNDTIIKIELKKSIGKKKLFFVKNITAYETKYIREKII